MPTITLCLDVEGKLSGLAEKDQRAYAKFKERIKNLGQGSITFSWREPRSGPHHRRFFAVINALYEGQEQFDNPDTLRLWLEVGAGHCSFVPGPMGKMVALPKSIAYEKLDEAEFSEIEGKIFKFVRSEHATRFLWPHLSAIDGDNMVSAILQEFEN